MSWSRMFFLYCDGGLECPVEGFCYGEGLVDPRLNVSELRQNARLDGWIRRGANDYCPDCAKRIHPSASRRNQAT